MSRIRGRDTTPELLVRLALWQRGLRYRVRTKLPGRPDIVFGRLRVAVFIDGCFWHACPEHGVEPKANAQFWQEKLGTNVQRDLRATAALRATGWHVLRFWEHEVERDLGAVVTCIEKTLRASRTLPTAASGERSRSVLNSETSQEVRRAPRRSGRR